MPLTLAIISVLAVLATAATWAMWPWLDRAPLGRNEGDMSWFHRHDEYSA